METAGLALEVRNPSSAAHLLFSSFMTEVCAALILHSRRFGYFTWEVDCFCESQTVTVSQCGCVCVYMM